MLVTTWGRELEGAALDADGPAFFLSAANLPGKQYAPRKLTVRRFNGIDSRPSDGLTYSPTHLSAPPVC